MEIAKIRFSKIGSIVPFSSTDMSQINLKQPYQITVLSTGQKRIAERRPEDNYWHFLDCVHPMQNSILKGDDVSEVRKPTFRIFFIGNGSRNNKLLHTLKFVYK